MAVKNLQNPNSPVDGHPDSDTRMISDEEENSWADELSQSYGSQEEEDYYDEESPSPLPGKVASARVDEGEDEQEDETKPGQRIVINVYCTEYDVVKKVARKECNFKIREYAEDYDGAILKGESGQKLSKNWDISWHDLSIAPDFLSKMHTHQKVNHYPGMYVVTRKHHLARNLMRMRREFPLEYDFFPPTWVVPGEV